MNNKVTANPQLSTTEPKTNIPPKQTKETSRTGTESQKWRSHGGSSARRGWGLSGGKGKRNKKHK